MTLCLAEISRGLKTAGHRVFYLAPTTAAVKVLQKEGFSQASTVSRFLHSGWIWENLRGAVFIVDEAGLQSNRQGAAILKLAKANNARVLLVGDFRQHGSVEAGDFLRILEQHSRLRIVELRDIQRQKTSAYRDAVKTMSRGSTRLGLEKLDALGWVKEGGPDYLQQAAADYLRLSADSSKTVMAVTPTWAENEQLTASIRKGLKAHGKLGDPVQRQVLEPLAWTAVQRRDPRQYEPGLWVKFHTAYGSFQPGDRVTIESVTDGQLMARNRLGHLVAVPFKQSDTFDTYRLRPLELAVGDKLLIRENRPDLNLHNGEVLTLSRISSDGIFSTQEGKTFPIDELALSHGYVLTSHKAQGRTVDHVVVAAARLNHKACYVSCSRARESCVIHCPSTEHLLAGLSPRRTGDRPAALEALPRVPITPRFETPALSSLVVGVCSLARVLRPALAGIGALRSMVEVMEEWSRMSTAHQPQLKKGIL